LIGVVAVVAALPFSKTLITQQERDLISDFGRKLLGRLAAYRSTRVKPVEAGHAI
jgi:hypothetical protein